MSSTEQTHTFTLTEGQLIFLRYVLEREFIEFLEYARDSTKEPGIVERAHVDGFVELCEIFGVEIPEVPEKLARQIVVFVQSVRQLDLQKKPGLAETLDWVAALLRLGVGAIDANGVEQIMDSLSALIKTREDQAGMTRPVVEKLAASC